VKVVFDWGVRCHGCAQTCSIIHVTELRSMRICLVSAMARASSSKSILEAYLQKLRISTYF
jgi:hypothetical protein